MRSYRVLTTHPKDVAFYMKKKTILLLLIASCSFLPWSSLGQEGTKVSSLKVTEPSHIINNTIITCTLQEYISKYVKPDPLFNMVIVRIDRKDENTQDIYISATNFESECVFYQFDTDPPTPKGYLEIDGVLIVLYNDIDTFFKKIREPVNPLNREVKPYVLVEVHPTYRHYVYRKLNVFGAIEEYIEFVQELDEIDK